MEILRNRIFRICLIDSSSIRVAPPPSLLRNEVLAHGPPSSEAILSSIAPLPPLAGEARFCCIGPPTCERSELLAHRRPYLRGKRASASKRNSVAAPPSPIIASEASFYCKGAPACDRIELVLYWRPIESEAS